MTDSVKQFASAADEATDDITLELTHTFEVLGEKYVARLPTKAEVALWYIAANGDLAGGYDETIRFMSAVLHDSTWDDEDGNLLRDEDGNLDPAIPEEFDPDEQMKSITRRWRRVRDKLAPEHFIPVVRWLIEQRTVFPTTSPSGSSAGQRASGASSTAGTQKRASTRSRSTRAVS